MFTFCSQVQPKDLNNGVINACFLLLFKDLIKLYACYNDGIINLLGEETLSFSGFYSNVGKKYGFYGFIGLIQILHLNLKGSLVGKLFSQYRLIFVDPVTAFFWEAVLEHAVISDSV